MMELKLKILKLKNFKGIQSFTLAAHGKNVSVFGDNATGKTTLFDAFLWLLFDKDSANRKDFDIKTLDEDGQPIRGLDHEVEAVLDMDGQRQLTLRKVYREQWTKRRGGAEKTFTGHTVDHFIDGVPAQKKEYEARVTEIAPEDAFRLLTNPRHFNDMLHWQKRRELLLDVCGDITDADVIASDKALAKLPDILQGRKLEDHRKVIAARRSEINKELERIPTRIDEVTQGLPDVTGLKKTAIEKELDVLKELKKNKEQERIRLESGGEVAEKQKALRELEGELQDLKNQLRADIDEELNTSRKDLGNLQEAINELTSAVRTKERTVEDNQQEIERLNIRMKQLRDAWHEEDAVEVTFAQEDTCPTCGQALPAEQLDEAREKALARFNKLKANDLENITQRGKDAKLKAGELAMENTKLEKQINSLRDQISQAEEDKAKVQARIDELRAKAEDVVNNQAYIDKSQGLRILNSAIEDLRASNAEALSAQQQEIDDLDNKQDALSAQLTQFNSRESGLARIEQLKEQERDLAKEFEELEEQLYLTEQFIRSKVQLLESKINSRFKYARFKMFEVQINGAITETCETLFNGIPYSSALNNAARMNVGLDIINKLSEHYDFDAPIFVDNAEAVTKLIPTKAQLIKLIVSEPDKTLRIEQTTEKLEKEAV